jgi:hypothetical protein
MKMKVGDTGTEKEKKSRVIKKGNEQKGLEKEGRRRRERNKKRVREEWGMYTKA